MQTKEKKRISGQMYQCGSKMGVRSHSLRPVLCASSFAPCPITRPHQIRVSFVVLNWDLGMVFILPLDSWLCSAVSLFMPRSPNYSHFL